MPSFLRLTAAGRNFTIVLAEKPTGVLTRRDPGWKLPPPAKHPAVARPATWMIQARPVRTSASPAMVPVRDSHLEHTRRLRS